MKQDWRTWLLLLACGALVACGETAARVPRPTAHINLATSEPVAILVAAAAATTPGALPTPAPASGSLAPPPVLEPLEQYRAWMEEARARYPYVEPLEAMWQVMLCESSGNPDTITGEYHGLFQYSPSTWSGDWNPYREQSILDPQAQIFATAKAWHDGNQLWWGCYAS